MKEEHQLLLVSLLLLSMMALASSIEPERVDVIDIDVSDIGESFTVEGIVVEVRNYQGHTFFELNDGTGSLDVSAFKQELDLKRGQEVKVSGVLRLQKGEKSLVADEINLSKS